MHIGTQTFQVHWTGIPILTLCKPEGIPLRFFLSFVAVSMHFCGILRLL